MQDFIVNLSCKGSDSFYANKAANSVNLDIASKLEHNLKVSVNITDKYSVGLIIGSSGSGKTTLAKKMFGDDCLENVLKMDSSIIDQFSENLGYEERVDYLTGVGLTSIPCWIRPVYTLSTGQRERAEAAIKMSIDKELTVIDEWTSTVNREVAKVMSHSIQKAIRKTSKKIVLISCHYDIIDWLNPDWIIDCNLQTFEDRRSLQQDRREKLNFHLKRCDSRSWKNFSQYHYLSKNLAGGRLYNFGLYSETGGQIGFISFACYSFVNKKLYHSNRVVIHPDYIGLGLGIKMTTEASKIMHSMGFTVMAKFTSIAMLKARRNHPNWKCRGVKKMLTKKMNSTVGLKNFNKRDTLSAIGRNSAKKNYVVYYFYEFVI